MTTLGAENWKYLALQAEPGLLLVQGGIGQSRRWLLGCRWHSCYLDNHGSARGSAPETGVRAPCLPATLVFFGNE